MTYPATQDELTDGVPSDGAAPTTELDDATYPHDDHHRALAATVEGLESVVGYGGTMPGDLLFPDLLGQGVGMVGFPLAGFRFGVDAAGDVGLYGIAGGSYVVIYGADDSLDLYGAGGVSFGDVFGNSISSNAGGLTLIGVTIDLDSVNNIIDVNTARLTNVVDPSGAQDAATKASQDAAVAAEATLARNGDNITSGTVADARIASTIARDSEVAAAYQPLDADLTDIAAIADAQGDIIVRGAAGWERLAKSATSTDVLTAGASQPAWAAAAGGAVATDAIFDAKGDLPVGTGADTTDNVAVGADRTLLRSDSNATPGVRWAFDLIRTRSTGWHTNAGYGNVTGQAWPTINRAYYVPWFLPGRNLITAVGVNVTGAGTAGNVVRLGIYDDNGSFGPGTILDQGTVAGDAIAFRTWTPAASVAVTDLFWVVAAPQGSTSPGSVWMSTPTNLGLAMRPPPETGAAWAGTYAVGISQFEGISGAFANSPTLSPEGTANRNPYLGLRLA